MYARSFSTALQRGEATLRAALAELCLSSQSPSADAESPCQDVLRIGPPAQPFIEDPALVYEVCSQACVRHNAHLYARSFSTCATALYAGWRAELAELSLRAQSPSADAESCSSS